MLMSPALAALDPGCLWDDDLIVVINEFADGDDSWDDPDDIGDEDDDDLVFNTELFDDVALAMGVSRAEVDAIFA